MNLDPFFDDLIRHGVPIWLAVSIIFVAAMFMPALRITQAVFGRRVNGQEARNTGDALTMAREALVRVEDCEAKHRDALAKHAECERKSEELERRVQTLEGMACAK